MGRDLANVQEKISLNKDLDLPTQHQLLAQFRCDEISTVFFILSNKEIYRDFKDSITAFSRDQDHLSEGSIGISLHKICTNSLGEYNNTASRYHSETYKKILAELIHKLLSDCSSVINARLRKMIKSHVYRLEAAFKKDFSKKHNLFSTRSSQLIFNYKKELSDSLDCTIIS